ncbi:MAG TPA: protocatechuate 3,4-dioxygenase subunit alpha [Usitatibacter sp.]
MERTPSQTIGPYFHEGLRWPDGGKVAFTENGKRIVLSGRIVDGAGNPVGDAMVETWQRSAQGSAPAPATGSANPSGFGRVETAKDGTFRIETSLPGGAPPFIDVAIFARGLLKALRTRVYLAPESDARRDPAMAPLAASPRLKTLVATAVSDSEYRWDVRLQGEGETVFFAF